MKIAKFNLEKGIMGRYRISLFGTEALHFLVKNSLPGQPYGDEIGFETGAERNKVFEQISKIK